MAFTSGNDINILQGTDLTTVGAGAGNDRYVLTAATLNANQKITISDTQGTNTLQLVGGLQIVSSKVAADAVLLTLNNGAVITVLGASTFTFLTGGDSLAGTGGLSQNFSAFATQSLGVTVPAAGAPAVDGGAATVNANGGTTVTPIPTETPTEAPTSFSLTASVTNLVEEGNNVAFTVTPSKASAAAVTLYVQISGAAVGAITTQAAADDFSAVLLPITIPAGSTAPVTVSATVNADTTTEGPEGFQAKLLDSGFVVVAGSNTITGTITEGVTSGKTYMLTKALDNVPGTSGNDTIIGSISATAGDDLDTLSTLDIVNGGAGTDTLKIASAVAAIRLPNMTNVEIVEVEGTAGVTVNTSAVAGVTNLNVTKAAGAVAATAAATTDVSVAIKDNSFAAAADHTVTNGNNVTFSLTDAGAALVADADDIAVTGAKGNVVVNATAKAADNAAATLAMGTIGVTGGKTVSVTQKVGDAAGLVAGSAATTHTQGNVTVTADATTTDVTVKQDKAATAASTAAVTGVTEVASVKFTKLDAGESVTISGLTFTAAAGKNLTADQVAAAFANLSASAIKPTDVTPTTATGDTNGGSASANGTFTGALLADWTSGAATGDTVVFTGKANTAMATDLVASAKATVTTTTQGVTAVTAANTLGVVNGTVTIAGAAALKTVTVDGYAASTGAAGITGGTNNALDTISLANGGNFEIDSAAATLGLTLANVNGTVDVAAGTKTLNAAVSHAKATETSTLVSASAETVNVTGAGNVAGNTTAGLTAATAINTSGMTAGNATFTIANGTTTSYTGGAGVDSVTVSNAGTAITKAIDLGAGDDTLTLTGAPVVAPTATLKGGDGTDTISMSGASAEALSANSTFAGKIEGFEKLYINDKVAAATTVNMANMDGITYVVSGNSTAVASAAVDENGLVTFQNLTAGQSVTVAGRTVTVSAGASATAAEIATAFLSGNPTTTNATNVLAVTGALTGWTAATSAAGVLKFTSTTAGSNVAADLSTTISDTGLTQPTAVLAGTKTDGTAGTAESTAWTMQGLTNGQSFTIASLTVTANKTLTATEVAAAFTAGVTSAGNYTVSGAYVAPATWTAGAFSDNGAGVLTLTNGANVDVTDFTTAPTRNAAGASPTDAAVSSYVQGAAAGAGAATAALTIDKMANNGTLELVAAGDGAVVKMADATGSTDSFNIVTKVSTVAVGNLNFGEVDVAGVETLKLNAVDTEPTVTAGGVTSASIQTATLDVKADKATSLTIEGNSNVTLTLDAASTLLATVNAGTLTGALNVGNTLNAVAMTITGGSGADVLKASVGATAKADVLNGGDGNDTLVAGSNGAKLTGGAGNDTFLVKAAATNDGNKESNTYTDILDFQAGDLLQLQYYSGAGTATADVTGFTKLAATLNENTAVFSDFVNAAIKEAAVGAAVYFNYKGDAYVVIDSNVNSAADTFINGEDLVVKLTGINGDNLSWNSDFATVALI
jgi:hypothetical protein